MKERHYFELDQDELSILAELIKKESESGFFLVHVHDLGFNYERDENGRSTGLGKYQVYGFTFEKPELARDSK